MRDFTTITPTGRGALPEELAFLHAPVFAASPLPQDGEPVGHVEGVVLGHRWQIVFFIVRLNYDDAVHRILIPLAALDPSASRTGPEWSLVLSWTVEQVVAQPYFVSDAQPPREHDGQRVKTGRWMPAVPNPAPPGKGLNHPAAWRQRLLWAGTSAMMGIVIGLFAGVSIPIALGLALFFGLGGGIAGSMYGYSRDSATDASEFHIMEPSPEVAAMVKGAERALLQTDAFDLGTLRATLLRARVRRTDREDSGRRAPPAMGTFVRD